MKISNLFIFLLCLFFVSCVSMNLLNEKNWLSATSGRTKNLFFSFNEKEIFGKFVLSGVDLKRIQVGEWDTGAFKYGWEILLKRGVYYSNQDNPDTSQDKPASVLVHYVKDGKATTVFVAKGYIFSIKTPNTNKEPDTSKKPAFILRHWSGAIGCAFTDFIFYRNIEAKPVIERRRTQFTVYDGKDRDKIVVEAWKLCK